VQPLDLIGGSRGRQDLDRCGGSADRVATGRRSGHEENRSDVVELNLEGLTVRAVSVGGFETCIEVPSWRLCFDIGRCPPTTAAYNRVLFTHAHVDHMAGVVHHCAQRSLTGRSAPEYWVPAESFEAFEEMMVAWRRLAHSELACTTRAVRPGDHIELGGGKSVVVFRAVHRIPSVGYALVHTRNKLKAEFAELPGPALAGLRRDGVEITEPVTAVELAFCGDTTIDCLSPLI
jgi:ribonuclease Z